jgi:Tfp pilus assembly protein PilF
MKRQIKARLVSSDLVIQICNEMVNQKNSSQAIELLHFAIEDFEEHALKDIFHTLSIYYLNQSQAKNATIYLERALALNPTGYSSWLHLSYARALTKDYESAKEALNQAFQYEPIGATETEQYLKNWLQKTLLE